jgi:hypothetical protein
MLVSDMATRFWRLKEMVIKIAGRFDTAFYPRDGFKFNCVRIMKHSQRFQLRQYAGAALICNVGGEERGGWG